MKLTSKQNSIIVGSLLGDGGIIETEYGHCVFRKGQAKRRKAYLDWTFDEMQPLSGSVTTHKNYCEGKEFPAARFNAKAHPIWDEFRKKWYQDGVKIIPEDITLDSLSISIWFFDDGCNQVKRRECSFATNGFTRDECELLCEKLLEHKIEAYTKNTVNVILVKCSSYKNLVDMIKPYMLWKCFENKVRYRDTKHTSDEEARMIFELKQSGLKQKEIALEVGKSFHVVSNILRGKTKHLERLGLVA
jgi:hypothetical protein